MRNRFVLRAAALLGSMCAFGASLSPLSGAETADELLDRYHQLFQAGKAGEAAEVLRRPELKADSRKWFGLGQLALKKKDFTQAADCFRRGAEQGSWLCMFSLGILLQNAPPGVKKDEKTAFRLIRQAEKISDSPLVAFETGRMISLGIGTARDLNAALPFLEKAANAEKPPQGAQLLAGLANRELKKFKEAYEYLEKAAKDKQPEAWEKLGDLYAEGGGLDAPHPRWACLCYKAAYRLAPSPRLSYNIGLTAARYGDRKEAAKWMTKAAEENYAPAREFLADLKIWEKVLPGAGTKDPKGEALRGAVNSHFKSERKLLGADPRSVLADLGKLPELTGTERMIRLPQPPDLALKSWCFRKDAVAEMIANSLFLSREGDERWFDSDFENEPLQENLLYPNPTIRVINSTYEKELKKALRRSGYKQCDPVFTQKLVKLVDPESLGEELENDVWRIGDDFYLHIHGNFQGRWQVRTYSFIGRINGDYDVLCSFDTPPDRDDADMALGLLAGNDTCLNNYAVKLAEGETDSIFRQDSEAESIFKQLIEKHDPVAAWNLAVLCRNRNQKALAAKYLALAKKFAAEKKVKLP